MVQTLVGPFIVGAIVIILTVAGIISYRIRQSALNPPPTIDEVIARQQAELDEINKQISEG